MAEEARPQPSWLGVQWMRRQYDLRPTPRIPLRGVRADIEALYDGEMVAATIPWWAGFLDKRPILEKYRHYRRLDGLAANIQRAIPTENRSLLQAMARHTALPFPRLAEASFALSYVMARTFYVALGNDPTPGSPITPEDIDRASRPYSLAVDYDDGFDERSPRGWWATHEERYSTWAWAVQAIRWAYNDQVTRWEDAEGLKMGEGVGFANLAEGAGLVNKFADLLFEQGARFFDAER